MWPDFCVFWPNDIPDMTPVKNSNAESVSVIVR